MVEALGNETLIDLFERTTQHYAQNTAVQCLGSQLTYEQLYHASTSFAAYLQAQGYQKGDRVALMLPNLTQYIIALYGTLIAGLTVVNVNPMYKAQELQHIINDSQPVAIVVLASATPELAQALQQLPQLSPQVIVTQVGDCQPFLKRLIINYKKGVKPSPMPDGQMRSFRVVYRQGRRLPWHKPNLSVDDMAFLQYTGGTTGVPKAAMLSHGNIRANVEQAFQWISPPCQPGQETLLAVLPLFHIFSLVANALVALLGGSTLVLVPDARDISSVIQVLRRETITVLMGINTLFEALLRRSQFSELDLSQLRLVIGGGMAVHHEVAANWLHTTGTPILQGYGLTEASPIVCINPVECREFNGSVGLPVAGTQVCVVDDNDNKLPEDEVGELSVYGPQVMQGYWQRPDETAQVLQNGWLYTGDMARIDSSGFVYIVDRKKDMIIVSGYNVYPQELEAVLMEHPAIQEAAIIGEHHPQLGEVLKAFIVPAAEGLTKADVISYCRDNFVSYKVPRRVEFIQQLPKSNVGKVLKKELHQSS